MAVLSRLSFHNIGKLICAMGWMGSGEWRWENREVGSPTLAPHLARLPAVSWFLC